MDRATATRSNVASDTETADRGRTGHHATVRAAETLAAPALLWRIWAGLILAQILAAGIIGTAPTASALCVAAMIPAALVDVRSRRLPNRLVAGAAAVLAAALAIGIAAGTPVDVLSVAVGVVAMGGPLLAIHLVSPGSMGFGDVKAAFVLGAAVGVVHWQLALSALALAAGFSATVAILTHARSIPLGPGLVSGAAVALTFSGVFVPTADPDSSIPGAPIGIQQPIDAEPAP